MMRLSWLLVWLFAMSSGARAQTVGGINITDGTTTVNGAKTLRFTAGCTVSGAYPTANAACSGGGGTVTSVALQLPASTFAVTGSPVASAGTLVGAFVSQSAKYVLAAPVASAGTPSWRQLSSADISDLSSNYLPLAGGTMSGSIVVADTTAALDSGAYPLRLRSSLPDAGSTSAFALDTAVSLTSGRDLLTISNGGVPKLTVGWDGDLMFARTPVPGDQGTYRRIFVAPSIVTDQQGTGLVLMGGDGGPGNGAGGTVILRGGNPNGTGIYGGLDGCFKYCSRFYVGGDYPVSMGGNGSLGGGLWFFGAAHNPFRFASDLANGEAAVTALPTTSAGGQGPRVELRGGDGGAADSNTAGGTGGDGVGKGGSGGAGSASHPGGNGGAYYVLGGAPGADNGGGQGAYGPVLIDASTVYLGTGSSGVATGAVNIGAVGVTTTIAGSTKAAIAGLRYARLDQSAVTISLTQADSYLYLTGNTTAHAVLLPDPSTLSLSSSYTQCFNIVCDGTCASFTTYLYALPYGSTKINGVVTQNSGTGARLLTEAYASVSVCTNGTDYFASVLTGTSFAVNP